MTLVSKTLDNSRMFIQDIERTMTFSYLGVGFAAGSRFDPPGLEGASHLLEHLLFKGTKTKNAEQINREFSRLGADSNAFTSWNTVFYYSKVPTKNLQKTADLWQELLEELIITDEDFEHERQVVLEELKITADTPVKHLSIKALQNLLPNHSFGKPIGGNEGSVNKITREQLEEFMSEYYTPEGSLLMLVGGIPEDSISERIETIFSRPSEKRRVAPLQIEEEYPKPVKDVHYIDRKGNTAYGEIITVGPRGDSILGKIMHLFTYFLGSSKRSPLYKALIRRGLASDIEPLYYVQPDVTVWGIGFSASITKIQRVLESLLQVLEEVLSMRWGKEILESWLEEFLNIMNLNGESVSYRAFNIIEEYYDHRSVSNLDAILEVMRQTSVDDMNSLVEELKKQTPFSLSLLGPRKAISLPESELLP